MELSSKKIGLCHSFAWFALRIIHSSSFSALVCMHRKMHSQTLLLNSGCCQKWEALTEKQQGRRKGEARVFLLSILWLRGHLLLLQLPSRQVAVPAFSWWPWLLGLKDTAALALLPSGSSSFLFLLLSRVLAIPTMSSLAFLSLG